MTRPRVQVLIPMAGRGSRFAEAGYSDPKPFIEVEGRPMILGVVDDLRATFDVMSWTFVCRKEHEARLYRTLANNGLKDVVVLTVPEVTEGACCTALLARNYLEDDAPLVIANSDQRFRCSAEVFPEFTYPYRTEGGWPWASVMVFDGRGDRKWSYVDTNRWGGIVDVMEKPKLADPRWSATCGIYCFIRTGDFFEAADRMVAANDRVNGEFYIAPALNYIPRDCWIHPVHVDEFHGLGTPEDLLAYLKRSK